MQIKDCIRGNYNFLHTIVPISKPMNIPAAKMAMEGRLEEVLLQESWEKVPS